MERFAAIAREITALTGTRCAPAPQRRVTGGSINECYCWPGDAGAMFVKVAAPSAHAMFAAEAAGLAELEWAHAVRVPRVLASGHTPGAAFLALEWIEAGGGGAGLRGAPG
jgi:fructosamine-3-kinase